MKKFYKALKGTEVYEEYGEMLIPYETVAFEMSNSERRQVEDASAEDLARAFNESGEFDADVFQALAEMAEIDDEDDRDDVLEEIGRRLSVHLN